MLTIDVEGGKEWDDDKECFVNKKPIHLTLEHSLISISKWESKWCKPFLSNVPKTEEESLDYIRCMAITQNVTIDTIKQLPIEKIQEVNSYIENPMSGTTFSDYRPQSRRGTKRPEVTSSEQIYYWMIAYNIPFECEKWHLNRLMNLVKICGIEAEKQDPNSKKKMSRSEILARNKALNAQRRKAWGTKG